MPPIGKSKPAPPVPDVCPVCKSKSCYHCWDCRRDLSKQSHKPGCPDDPSVKEKRPDCIACSDTGKNSRGGPCHACLANGRIKEPKPIPPSLRGLFE